MNGGGVNPPRLNQAGSLLECVEICGADRDRTDDLRLAKPALSQLSYSPVWCRAQVSWAPRVGQGRLELPTSRLSGVRSNHLSYWPGQVTAFAAARPSDLAGSRVLPELRAAFGRPRSLETEPYARFDCGS
jgi:hypothetical protein